MKKTSCTCNHHQSCDLLVITPSSPWGKINTVHLLHTQGSCQSSLQSHPHNILSQTNITQNGTNWQLPITQPATKEGTTTKYIKQCNYNIWCCYPNNTYTKIKFDRVKPALTCSWWSNIKHPCCLGIFFAHKHIFYLSLQRKDSLFPKCPKFIVLNTNRP